MVAVMRQNKESIDITIEQWKIWNAVIKGNLNFTFALNLITGFKQKSSYAESKIASSLVKYYETI